MVFENIDEYMENLDLFVRLNSTEVEYMKAQREIQRLTEENNGYKRTLDIRRILQAQRDERTSKLEAFNRSQKEQYRDFTEFIDGDSAKNMVRRWIRDPRRAPAYFIEWIEKEKRNHLFSIIDNPSSWTPEFRKRVENSLKKSQPSS